MNLPDHIAYAYQRLNEVAFERAPAILSDAEQAYLKSVQLEKRRREFVAGRILARELSGRILQRAAKEVEIRVEEDGSLSLGRAPYGVSLAHSREGVCAAVARGAAVGIDLEYIQPRHDDLYRFVLHPEEYALLDTLPVDRVRALILCWVLKEATLKGMKTGFRCSPKKLKLDIDPGRSRARVLAPENKVWCAHFEERDGHYLAVSFPL